MPLLSKSVGLWVFLYFDGVGMGRMGCGGVGAITGVSKGQANLGWGRWKWTQRYSARR